jgi:Zn finger protein HypA/HybF involved in hydrogenase expression
MTSAQERAKALAVEMRNAVKEAKAAEARARRLGEAVMLALAEARSEAEKAATIVEYPTGRYECKSCHQGVLFTEPTRVLPACDNCGGREYIGAEPRVIKFEPPPVPMFPAGLYECGACGARNVLVTGTDTAPTCDLCGADRLKPLA